MVSNVYVMVVSVNTPTISHNWTVSVHHRAVVKLRTYPRARLSWNVVMAASLLSENITLTTPT